MIAVFARHERSFGPIRGGRTVPKVRVVAGVALICVGLAATAGVTITSPDNLWAFACRWLRRRSWRGLAGVRADLQHDRAVAAEALERAPIGKPDWAHQCFSNDGAFKLRKRVGPSAFAKDPTFVWPL